MNQNGEELYHFGVKGMRWGVRRYQNKDGTLTNAGLRRAKKFEQKTNKEATRIAEKGITFKNKSKHRLKLEEQYKQRGLSDEQAQAAANNRIRTERAVTALAAVAATAAVATYAYKRHKRSVDGIIKAGDNLQRIETTKDGKLHDVFYATNNAHDNRIYEGRFGSARIKGYGKAYKMELKAMKDVKIASQDKAAKTFGELYKNDPDFRRSASSLMAEGEHKIRNKNNLSNRNVRKMYENFNSGLVYGRFEDSRPDLKFYDALKKQGYGAVQDINDMKFSGYNAKNPLIIFDNSEKTTSTVLKKGLFKTKKITTEHVTRKIVPTAITKLDEGETVAKGLSEFNKAKQEQKVSRLLKRMGSLSVGLTTTAAAATYASMPVYQTSTTKTKTKRSK